MPMTKSADISFERSGKWLKAAAKRIENTLAHANPTITIIADRNPSESATSIPANATIAKSML